jgi:hypothetical protein
MWCEGFGIARALQAVSYPMVATRGGDGRRLILKWGSGAKPRCGRFEGEGDLRGTVSFSLTGELGQSAAREDTEHAAVFAVATGRDVKEQGGFRAWQAAHTLAVCAASCCKRPHVSVADGRGDFKRSSWASCSAVQDQGLLAARLRRGEITKGNPARSDSCRHSASDRRRSRRSPPKLSPDSDGRDFSWPHAEIRRL